MKIKVTMANILEYGLDTLTGNSQADLMARAKEMEANGFELYVTIPDAQGGDRDAPNERNNFEHYEGFPEPDGYTHPQESINLEQQAYLENPCSYWANRQIDGSVIWICVKHNEISKHSVDKDSHAPCIVVDPYTGDL